MIRRAFLLWTALPMAIGAWSGAPAREHRNFDQDWRFHKGDVSNGESAAFDDRGWRRLDLPHDWSIEGRYAAINASGTGYLPGGIGWYRKSFTLPESLSGRKVFIEFDGVYRDSDVWINGRHVGHRPSGYSSFEYDLTPHVRFGGAPNLIAVRVDHSVIADSRWYTGSGIYRHVWLTITPAIHVVHWGTYVRTPVVRDDEALVSVETAVSNESDAAALVRLITILQDADGRELGSVADEEQIARGATHTFAQQGRIPRPALWSPERPRLYTVLTRVYSHRRAGDESRTQFGIRTLRFDPRSGFFLNGRPTKFQGVCIHHDLGALGAAFSEATLERRLKALKELGTNAIRCSHNPMAPELYYLCDRLGLLVMDEAFDEWTGGKRKWAQGWNVGTAGTRGYHEVFDEWWARDLGDMIRRDRNHPSVVMWSIGNEIEYPGDPFTHPFGRNGAKPGTPSANVLPLIARRLLAGVKTLDDTRPVTQALADIGASNATGLASLLDVTGYNYQEEHYARDHAACPERVILGTENVHSPAAWRAVAESEYVIGQFLWTGIDYLGEAGRYPNRGSQAGLLDWCGFRKPQAYIRQAMWSGRPMVYAAVEESERRLAEHWNWSADRKKLPVAVYTNCASAELFLNGRSLGEKKVTERYPPALRWEVPNEPGTVLAIGRRDGAEAARFELATAAAPDHLDLMADRTGDLVFVEVRVADAAGRWARLAEPVIEFVVTGGGRLIAMDTGDPRDINPVQGGRRKSYQGRALAIVRCDRGPGKVTMRASAEGLKPAEAVIMVP